MKPIIIIITEVIIMIALNTIFVYFFQVMHSNVYDNNVTHKDTEITKTNSTETDDGMLLISIRFNLKISSYLYVTS